MSYLPCWTQSNGLEEKEKEGDGPLSIFWLKLSEDFTAVLFIEVVFEVVPDLFAVDVVSVIPLSEVASIVPILASFHTCDRRTKKLNGILWVNLLLIVKRMGKRDISPSSQVTICQQNVTSLFIYHKIKILSHKNDEVSQIDEKQLFLPLSNGWTNPNN